MKTTNAWAAALAALGFAGPLQAHHSGSMYESTPLWIRGTVVRFEGVNPHTITTLEQRSADGQVRRWAVEGPGQSQLDRSGSGLHVPEVGQTIELCAFPYKSAAELSRLFPGVDFRDRHAGTDGSSPQFVAGHVMVMPDGQRQLWEPHGLISECIRSSDEPGEAWLGFIESNPRVRQAWCEQNRYALVQSNATLRQLVEGIDGLIDNPCD